MFYYLVFHHLCCLSPFLSHPTSFNLFNVLLGSWAAMAVGGWAVIAFGEWGGRTVSPFPTSTLHPRLHACPTCSVLLKCLFIVPIVHSLHGLFISQPTILAVLGSSRTELGGVFGLTQVSTLQFRVLHVGGSFSRRKLLSVGLSRTGNSWLYPRGFSSADSSIVRPYLSSRAEERAVFPRFCWLWSPTAFWAAGYLW